MNDTSLQAVASRWPHRLAVLLACATWVLLYVGGLVTTTGSGMAVPDWPTTYGYNLFGYPLHDWLAGSADLRIEHGHRLLAAGVGLLTIGLAALIWWKDQRRWVFYAAIAAVFLVCLQGVLGGLRVQFDARAFARIHGCVAPLFFAAAAALASFTSGWWRTAQPRLDRQAGRLQRLSIATALLAYVQIVLGAHLRHVADDASPRTFDLFVVFHLIGAAALAVHILLVAARTMRSFRGERLLRRPAILLVVMLLAQLGLGAGAWVTHYGAPTWLSGYAWAAAYTVEAQSWLQVNVTTAHVALGSLIWATSVVLALRSLRLLRAESRPAVVRGPLAGVVA